LTTTLNAATLGVNNIQGGAGNDTLLGDASANWLVGGKGQDRFNAGAGDDTLLIDAADTTNTASGGSANINAAINAGEGFDLVQVIDSYQTNTDGSLVTNADGSHNALGITLNMAQAQVEVAIGGSGADTLIGGGRSSVFMRGAANDAGASLAA
jgi:Ca2+-binding RTX toxin-like protein